MSFAVITKKQERSEEDLVADADTSVRGRAAMTTNRRRQ
jgi:hypothetical protein